MHKKPNSKYGNDKVVNQQRINGQIVGVTQVRLVTDDGSHIVPLEVALQQAREENLDLVEVSSGQDVPVCKIIDYGKFRFEQLKKTKEAKKKQHIITIKEIKLRPRIDIHDFEIKRRQAVEFLQKGDKVKVTLRFRGREMAHAELGMNVIVRLIDELKEYGTPEKPPVHDGKQIVCLVNPK
ncbi:MAG: translation initiation factor IF-3 [Leptospiraceae bacterium]|nr:translation initiation factor IF-3 [Leptospiraceae bacterium]MCP5510279.1 translation initiation factor IF-3 [Leptospiraceae bacterium]